jgi:Domain of unknown function (DUF4918)
MCPSAPSFSAKALSFYKNIHVSDTLPASVEVMNPYETSLVRDYVQSFLEAFFGDSGNRVYVFGINPGRFGAGLTGVTFTDPVALEDFCGIRNDLEKRRELSSEFIYEFIQQWGGPDKFYQEFFLTAVSPLGFIRHGKNYNYYDDPEMFAVIKPFIVESMNHQLTFGARRDMAIVLGTGQNQKTFNGLNAQYGWFEKVLALEHPRYIMQYQRKRLAEYFRKYREVFSQALK